MYDKKLSTIIAFVILSAAVLLSVFLRERYYHVFYHFFVISIIILSLFLSMKDVFIILMAFSSVVWILGFFGIFAQINQLLVETAVIAGVALLLGWYEMKFKVEKGKANTILDYKKKEIGELQRKIAGIGAENNAALDEIKKFRKEFRD
jgi:hypothetical protein